MTALLGLPLTLALVFLLGAPLARRLAPGLPRDLEAACGLCLGAGVLGLWCLLLAIVRAQTALAALAVLAAVPLLGRPRIPRRRELLAPVAWFALAALGLMLLQPVPRGAAWTNDWAWHFVADQHYLSRTGFGETVLPNGWPLLGRPPLFNLARMPAELVCGGGYAAAEAATAALSCVLPAGAWVLVRELAPFGRARRALWLMPASAFWVHFAAYPKPTAMSVGLALASLGIVLRLRRRDRPGLLPLAAALGAFAVMTHPAGALVLPPAALVAFRRGRGRLLAAAIALAILLPWPLWVSATAPGGLAGQDPVGRFAGAAPLSRGGHALAVFAWNVAASLLPSALLGHACAVATGAPFSGSSLLDTVVEAALMPLPAAIGVLGFVRWRREAALAHPRLAGAGVGALAVAALAGAPGLLQADAFAHPVLLHEGRVVDVRPVIVAAPLVALALLALGVRIARAEPARGGAGDLLAACVLSNVVLGMALEVRADFHGATPPALAGTCAILALGVWSQGSDRRAALQVVSGLSVLATLGVASSLGFTPSDGQTELAAALGFAGLRAKIGPAGWGGLVLLGAVGVRAFGALREGRQPHASRIVPSPGAGGA